jgi:hypothetical protein
MVFFVAASWGEVKPSRLLVGPLYGLFYQTRMMMVIDECGAVGGMFGKGNRSTRRKYALAPLCPPQIPHDLPQTGTRTTAVGSRGLTA